MSSSNPIRTIWLDEPQRIFEATAVTIGSFDGIHRGHCEILRRLEKIADERNLLPILLTFDPHPRLVLTGDISVLTTVSEREILLRHSKIFSIVHIRFTPKIASLSHKDFVERYLLYSLGAKYIIVGYDHHFGKNRGGNSLSLRQLGKRYGVAIEIVEPIKLDGEIIKSNTIRTLISHGKIERANFFLGHPYIVMGKCIAGRGLGSHIGYPTANLKFPSQKLLPPDGVYAATATILPQSEDKIAMVYIGRAPTFSLPQRMFEVHIFDHDGSPLYGKNIVVKLHKFIREDRSFKSVDELKRQIDDDAMRTKQIFKLQR
ncbi:riboflavin biosynthesis protein RibF [bacterium]|nr:riboflavin biosynthesis protein RibF [bacterium]